MDSAAQQAAAVIFVFALPGSLLGWVLGITSAGFLRDPIRQPTWFRIVARVVGPVRGRGPNSAGIIMAVVLFGVFNYFPVIILVRNPYGPQGLLVVISYAIVQFIFLIPVALALLRSGGPRSDG